MSKLVVGAITLVITFIIFSAVNNLLSASEPLKSNSSESFLTYNDTANGISIKYPLGWEIDESAHQFLVSFLQNLTANDIQNNEIKSKISEVLDEFGLQSVSDLFGLNPDKRVEFLQTMSKALNEGATHLIVMIRSPPEDDSDNYLEILNISVDNISALSPITLNNYVNASMESLKTLSTDVRIVQPPTEIKIGGNSAMTITFTLSNPLDATLTAKFLNVYTIEEKRGYVLTFSSTPESYPTYASTFEKMLHSFRINN